MSNDIGQEFGVPSAKMAKRVLAIKKLAIDKCSYGSESVFNCYTSSISISTTIILLYQANFFQFTTLYAAY